MNKLKLLLSLILLHSFSHAHAEVWKSSNQWNRDWERRYEEWVAQTLSTDMFTRETGLLAGISADCADVLYDVRIQFAYEHSLPFVINAPDVLRPQQKYFGSDTDMFDSIKDEKKRVRAFINFINDEVGTENLTKDTYPIKISEINSGVIYHVVWWFLGKEEHHSYILKGFNEDRDLLYYAGDAPRKVRRLQVDSPYPRFSYSSAPYGFRRWKHPEHLSMSEKEIPIEDGYSDEQYKLVARVGKKEILKEISRKLKNE